MMAVLAVLAVFIFYAEICIEIYTACTVYGRDALHLTCMSDERNFCYSSKITRISRLAHLDFSRENR